MTCAASGARSIATMVASLATACALLAAMPLAAQQADTPHLTDYLTNPGCQGGRIGTVFYANASEAQRDRCRQATKARGYTHFYLSANAKAKNWYEHIPEFEARVQELYDDGLRPVVFLTSHSGEWIKRSEAEIKEDVTRLVAVIDPLVSSYVVGYQADEYWSLSKTRAIGQHLRSLTDKPISVHMLPGKWSYCGKEETWCDYMILYYGLEKSTQFIRDMTGRAIEDIGKPVVAGEYSMRQAENKSIPLGDAALAAGAAGFGNGGTAAKIENRLAPLGADVAPSP